MIWDALTRNRDVVGAAPAGDFITVNAIMIIPNVRYAQYNPNVCTKYGVYVYIYIYIYPRFVIVVHNANITDFNLSPQVILGLIDLNHDEVILSEDNMFPSLAIPLITRNLSYHLNWRCFVTCRQPTPGRFYKCIFRRNTNHMLWSDVTKESWVSDHQELG